MEGAPRLLATLQGGADVRCVAAEGARLAAGAGSAVREWRADTAVHWPMACERRAAHRYGVSCVAWSAAGELLASGGVDGALRLWAGTARRPLVLAAPGAAAVRALCWAGARLAVGHDDGTLRLWAARGVLLATLLAHDAALTAICAADALAVVLTADADGVLKVFDLNAACSGTKTTLHWEDGAHDLGALCAAAATHDPLAASAGHDALIRIWRFDKDENGRRRVAAAGALHGHGGAVAALSWRGALLASGASDRTARVWRVAPSGAGVCLHVLPAHARYLTAVALDHRHRYLVTGSSDKTVRVWALGGTCADSSLQPPCQPQLHYALGDLEGIEAVPEEDLLEMDSSKRSEGDDDDGWGGSGAWRVGGVAAHGAALNGIAARGHLLATAASDGTVRVWAWSRRARALRLRTSLLAHEYPATLVALPAPALLSASLDGTFKLWDIESGGQLRAASTGASERVGAEEGSGVRGGDVVRRAGAWSALLATDAGAAQLWTLSADAATPDQVWGGLSAAMLCARWAGDARLAAGGGAGGELRVWAPAQPEPELLSLQAAHDLGVQALAWGDALCWRDSYVLATVGADSLLKLWLIDYDEEAGSAELRAAQSTAAHGGAASCVAWQPAARGELLAHRALDDTPQGSALVATGGEDRWARVWSVWRCGDALRVQCRAAVPAAAPVLALALLPPSAAEPGSAPPSPPPELTSEDQEEEVAGWLVLGTLSGEAAVWALAPPGADADDAQPEPRHWTAANVARWLAEYVAAPDAATTPEEAQGLLQRVREAHVTGPMLLDPPLHAVLELLGFAREGPAGGARGRVLAELHWLRRPAAPHEVEARAPHALLCPLSHRLLREPARAADGFTYERAALAEHFLAAGGAVSGVTRRRLRSARVCPNLRLRDQLRVYLARAAPELYAHLLPPAPDLLPDHSPPHSQSD